MHATQREGTGRGVDAGATVCGPAHVLHAARAVASTLGRRGVDVPLYGLGGNQAIRSVLGEGCSRAGVS